MLLQVRDLGIAYGKGDPVVRHVSFDLDAGQVLAIVGESGSRSEEHTSELQSR